MDTGKFRSLKIFSIITLCLIALLPMAVMAEETPLMSIEAAKSAIDQAQRAGAEQQALDDLSAAKSWLSQAEKAYAAEAKLKEAQMGAQRAKEVMEIKAKEEKFSAEKEKLAVVQAKLQALEQEKAMLTAAGMNILYV